jgi:hypothetical protein
MECDNLLSSLLEFQFSGFDQLLDELRVMGYFEIGAKLGIFILECVETVWALCHDFSHVVLLENLRQFNGALLKATLFPYSSSSLAITTLFGVQSDKIDVCGLENLDRGFRDCLVSWVIRTRTANPV